MISPKSFSQAMHGRRSKRSARLAMEHPDGSIGVNISSTIGRRGGAFAEMCADEDDATNPMSASPTSNAADAIREMREQYASYEGDLSDAPFARILARLHRNRATGRLHVMKTTSKSRSSFATVNPSWSTRTSRRNCLAPSSSRRNDHAGPTRGGPRAPQRVGWPPRRCARGHRSHPRPRYFRTARRTDAREAPRRLHLAQGTLRLLREPGARHDGLPARGGCLFDHRRGLPQRDHPSTRSRSSTRPETRRHLQARQGPGRRRATGPDLPELAILNRFDGGTNLKKMLQRRRRQTTSRCAPSTCSTRSNCCASR